VKIYDIVIIGGGVIGASLAREMSRYRLNIALLEKEEELAFGVSKSNSGIIHPGTQNPKNSLKGRLCVRGNELTRVIARELDVGFKEVGELIVIFNEDEMPRLIELKKEAEAFGVPRLRIVDKKWLKANEPNLNPEAIAALYVPTAGIISPYRWVYELSENALRNGVDIHTSTKVEVISPVNGDGYRFEVGTTKGVFKTKYIVNAAGLFADEVSNMVGLSYFRIKPRKGEEFLLDKKRQYLTNHIIFPLPKGTSKGVLVIKTADGNPMIGPTAHDIDDKSDLSTSDAGFEEVLTAVKRLVPAVDENDIIAYFAGLRPIAGEDFIIRHEDAVPGFINVAGIQSPGLTSAPAIAELVRKILKDKGLVLKKKLFFYKQRTKVRHLFEVPFSRIKKLIAGDHAYGDIVCRCETVSAKEIRDSIKCGAKTLDGIKFRTRAQSGRCHGSFCTSRIMKILAEERGIHLTEVTKRGAGSEIVKKDRAHA